MYAAFKGVDSLALKKSLSDANLIFLIPAVILTFVSIWTRSIRWHFLLLHTKRTRITNLFIATVVGFAINNVLPIRLGEFARAYWAGGKENINKISTFATLVVERTLDGVTLVFMLIVFALFGDLTTLHWVRPAGILACGGFLSLLATLAALSFNLFQTRILSYRLMKMLPARFTDKGTIALDGFLAGLDVFKTPKRLAAVACLSLLVWIPPALVVACLLSSFSINLPLSAALLILVVVCFGLMIPSAPGFIGTFQYFCVTALSLFGVDKDLSLAFSILYHLSQYVPVTILGLTFFLMEKKSLSEFANFNTNVR